MFNTVKLTTISGSGTGFFYNFSANGKTYPTIITNKHVVNNNPNETVTFFVHLKTGEFSSNENYRVTYEANWIFHSSKDLCFCPALPVFEEVRKKIGKDVFYIANDDSIIATPQKLNELSALEELVMVGYPTGLWDLNNNFPIFRRGYTASHPALSFNENGIGLVDMACFPGSSGSPIYVLNENGYKDKNGVSYLGQSRIIFIGILYAGPRYNVQTIPIQQTIQAETPMMINLGNYIKAIELKEFQEYIEKNGT